MSGGCRRVCRLVHSQDRETRRNQAPSIDCIPRSMGKCVEAVGDFDRAIELAPTEPDPNLGRGVARECLGKFAEAIEVGGWVGGWIGGWGGTLQPRVDQLN